MGTAASFLFYSQRVVHSLTALLLYDYFESEDIHRMDWPVRSPDLNPIQHVCDALGRGNAARNSSSRIIQELKTSLLQEWDRLQKSLIDCHLYNMMLNCESCMTVRGNQSPY
ncbi:hypothetical protein AVEN_88271-1 [Araneus ventricosus]|uniref:Tc1-like transposase DDE domain-containing protein n=1 Tax=Araneus ventricosus TaxID=182803 RepID=A0A4Y2EQ57_ARAVE|nr:hypothetical protein AVEN_88271-1 [Araneus ventricosus]